MGSVFSGDNSHYICVIEALGFRRKESESLVNFQKNSPFFLLWYNIQ